MKKISLLICVIAIILTLSFALTACIPFDPDTFYFDYDELKRSVVRVEYIYYNNPNAKEIDTFFSDKKMLPFDYNKLEIRQVLPDDKLDAFLKDLSAEPFMMHWVHLDSPIGDSIRVVYDNGDFEILCADPSEYAGSFCANGQIKRFIGNGFFKIEWIEKWFAV